MRNQPENMSKDARQSWADETLFEAARGGDEQAFRVLVDRHARVVRRLALSILSDAHEAEDIAQEAFVAAWRAKDNWTPDARFTTWLHRIAVNKAIDRYRRRRATPEPNDVITRLADAAPSAPVEDQQQALERRESARSLRDCLQRLPDSQRQALTLYYFEDLDVGRIAGVLDTTEQAVRSLLKRGKQALRLLIQRQKSLGHHGSFGFSSAAVDAGR
ncbi:RNA polymerase sigma factor [Caulobacter segnis]|uniref:RNA polymerase sigma factor n=2 Tax=Caulobacter segnis TaxID=88688 RepID=D5VEB2_CAUST|nr:sigma-70 family RNA polymerase sigma factor [Caulobacter segnis]ADG08935.1 RNA polymerase, sigma-24 subunit, ECF subfamily [Caulobacter segnis ATCC 21756]